MHYPDAEKTETQLLAEKMHSMYGETWFPFGGDKTSKSSFMSLKRKPSWFMFLGYNKANFALCKCKKAPYHEHQETLCVVPWDRDEDAQRVRTRTFALK